MPLHMVSLRNTGLLLGEMFVLDALAEACAADGNHDVPVQRAAAPDHGRRRLADQPAGDPLVKARPPVPGCALLFFASGASALVAETVWLRWFRDLFGATAPATSATLIAFFAGHALGAVYAARRAPRWRHPLRAYALLEAVATLGALAVLPLLVAGETLTTGPYDALRGQPAALAAMRFAVALVATLPAAFAFGASFPAIASAATGEANGLGRAGAALYASNLLGAAAGAAAGAFLLPDAIGVRGTWLVGAGLSAAAAVGAGLLARSLPPRETEAVHETRSAPLGPLSIAAVSGFGTLAAQVLLVQAHAQVLNQSVFAFGTVLVVTLVALGLGAMAIAWLSRRGIPAERALGIAAVAGALAAAAFPRLFFQATGGLDYVGSGEPWPGYLFTCLGLGLATAGPVLFACGLTFPLSLAWAAERAPDAAPGALLGSLVAANTVGAIAGALLAPYLLLPALGLWGAFAGVAAVYAAAAFLLPEANPALRSVRIGLLAAGWAGIFLSASPLEVPAQRLGDGERALHVASTPAGIVSVVERRGELLIRTDNHYALGGTAEIVHQERQSHVPLLLHPKARSVLHAGSATGISAGALLAHPVERIHLVELVPEVAAAGERFFAEANRGVHRDPRVEVVVDDARNYVAHTAERFDVVIADLFVPWRSGTSALYTREHFENVRERLEPGGLFCQWLPLYQLGAEEFHVLLATFLDVFPTAGLFRGDFYGRFPIVALVGWRDAVTDPAAIDAAVARLRASGERDRWVTEPEGFWSLYAGALGPLAAQLEATPRNTSDRPRLQYLAARHHRGGRTGLATPYVGIPWQRFTDGVRTAALLGDPLFPTLGPDGKRAGAAGAALQMAGALWVEGRPDEAARAIAIAADLLPPEILADAEADPTAAELWPDGDGG